MAKWFGQEGRMKSRFLHRDLETLLGNTAEEWKWQRGDFHSFEFKDRDANFLRAIGDPEKFFNRETFGKFSRGIGTGIDNYQAYSNRMLGAASGMNVATQYLSIAGQKSLIKEFDNLIRKLADNSFSRQDIGYMRQLGITRADLTRLKSRVWDQHIVRYGDNPNRGIQALMVDEWDPLDAAWFSNIMERGMGFMMGTATRGELPRRLDNPFIAALLQNRRYSMGAHEKALAGGADIGAGHMFHHMGMAMAVGMVGTYVREVVKAGPEGAQDLWEDDNAVFWRRVISSAPNVGTVPDTATLIAAPLVSFFDLDWANNMHFGYNRYDKGPARGGLDNAFEQIPVYKWASDGVEASNEYARNFDDMDHFKTFIYDLTKLAPAPLGNAMGSIILNNALELDEDKTWE
jgi:hypothetical protein